MGRTRRGIGVLAIVLLTGCTSLTGPAAPPPATTPPAAATPPLAAASEQPSADPEPAPTTLPIPEPAQTLTDGMQRSGVASSGEFETNAVSVPTSHSAPDERRLVVQVETSVPESVDGAALLIHRVLESERGWAGWQGIAFSLVSDAEAADLVIHLAAPATVDQACATLNTAGLWSCRVGADIYLNVDRWFYGTPT